MSRNPVESNLVEFLFFLFLSSVYNHVYVVFQLQLSPSRSAAEHMNGNDTRSCVQDEDEMEMTDFYVGGGSQSVDCEASPPSLQVLDFLLESLSFGRIFFLKNRLVNREGDRNRIFSFFPLIRRTEESLDVDRKFTSNSNKIWPTLRGG